MAWVYIGQCCDGSYYVGSTRDLDRRLHQHQAGEGAEFTKRRLPVHLVWAEECDDIGQAFAFEKRVQGWGRAKRQALIEGRHADLKRLSSRSRKTK